MLVAYSTIEADCNQMVYIWNTDDLSFKKIKLEDAVRIIQRGIPIQGLVLTDSGVGKVAWYPGMFESNGYRFAWEVMFRIRVVFGSKMCTFTQMDNALFVNSKLIGDCNEMMCPVLQKDGLYLYYSSDGFKLNRTKAVFIDQNQ